MREGLRHRVGFGALILAVMLPATAALAAVTDETDADAGRVASEEDVLEVSTALYAEHFQLSQSDATEQIVRREGAQSTLDLAAEHPGFAGATVIRDEGALVVEIRFKDGVPKDVAAAGGPLRFVENVGWSNAGLEETQVRIHEALVANGFSSVGSSIDTDSGEIDVLITRQRPLAFAELERNDTAAEMAALPDVLRQPGINVEFENEESGGLDHGYGGDKLRHDTTTGLCTSGFAVTDGYGGSGVLTAGHCGDLRHMEPFDGSVEFDTPFVSQHRATWGDWQWHTTTDHTDFDDFYADTGIRWDVNAIGGTSAVNDFRCRFGAKTNDRQCDYIYKIGVVKTYGGFTYRKLIALDTRIAQPGDSGGPIFYLGKAWGIHHGPKTVDGVQRDLYSQSQYVWDALGVVIRTS